AEFEKQQQESQVEIKKQKEELQRWEERLAQREKEIAEDEALTESALETFLAGYRESRKRKRELWQQETRWSWEDGKKGTEVDEGPSDGSVGGSALIC
ncbi:hypothetical protein HDV00_009543, partial [Rhizophlyctis rosea]